MPTRGPLALAALLAAGTALAQTGPAPAPLATVDGQPVTAAEIEAMLGPRLYELRNQEYALKRRALDEAVAKRLLEAEARRRGIPAEDFEKAEIVDKAKPVTEEDKRRLYEENKARLAGVAEDEALRRAGEFLLAQHQRERRDQLVAELRRRTPVKILLDAPRYDVGVDDDPSKGPVTAPVTIIEFSDFQCPFCSRALPILKQIDARYGDKVRVVFRDLPLVQIHKDAAKAAEAASCANEQGKFWAMHDRLFENQGALGVEDLKKHAAAVGLAPDAFAACLDSGKYDPEWKKDSEAAQAIGISGTPAFLINGRLVAGAQAFETFAQVIDEELERAGVPVPAPVAPEAK